MLPPNPTVSAHAALVVLRRHAGLLGRRVALDIASGAVVALTFSAAWQMCDHLGENPVATLATSAALALVAAALYVLFRVVIRAGTVRALLQRLRVGRDDGIALLGAEAFEHAFGASLALASVEGLGLGCGLLCLQLSGVIAAAHGVIGAMVAALMSAAIIGTAALASAFAVFVYALAVIDVSSYASAWLRFRSLLAAPGTASRFFRTALWFSALSALVSVVDCASTVVSTSMPEGALPPSFILVPTLVVAYGVLLDAVAVVFIAAATERLPLGIAARVALAVEPQ